MQHVAKLVIRDRVDVIKHRRPVKLVDWPGDQRIEPGEQELKAGCEVQYVRRGKNQTPSGPQHTVAFAYEVKLVLQMFDTLDTTNEIKLIVLNRKVLVKIE